MSGWINVDNGDIRLIHHSTASVIQIIVQDEDGTNEIWLDYYQFEQLKEAIEIIQPK